MTTAEQQKMLNVELLVVKSYSVSDVQLEKGSLTGKDSDRILKSINSLTSDVPLRFTVLSA